MLLTRRSLLQSAAALAVLPREVSDIETRVSRLVQAYSDQGLHRTGTAVDERSARWLQDEVRALGGTAEIEAFSVNRLDVLSSFVEIDGRRVEAIPLFDGGRTSVAGVSGRFGEHTAPREIGLLDLTPNQAGSGIVGDIRRRNAHRAIVCVTRGGRPGLCPSNADGFTAPFGPPVVQVSSIEAAWLRDHATRGSTVRVVANLDATPAHAFNVTAAIAGRDRTLPPLVVMTPRSGWYTCASERGGGIVCWVELMRALNTSRPRRDVLFVASSGHELGYIGIAAYVEKRPGIVARSAGWVHLGANIGAATDPANTVQSSDDEREALLIRAMAAARLSVDRRVPHDSVPGGEAGVVHRGGGKYVSVIGRNGLFHNPDDRGAATVDAAVVARFVDAFFAYASEAAMR